ncbi:MAG: RNA recognition motif domain-containing protein [Fluviibacter sp.]
MKGFGQRLYLTGISTDTQEVDLRELIVKYTHIAPCAIDRVDLNTALPAYVIEFEALNDGEVQKIASRINGMYWHGQEIYAHVI